ncbi:uncharacterized protein [Zea mays]|uniref:uncharacterized protein n=1 Tax=Zea mays TaxID=4577 RepID=UPI0009AA3FB3|nr:uncharacterized protein LOC109939671 [Zea mays]|eukprot:XP_020393565.1 uncharacterized protein LOC109939671 [Zea mays]
MGCCLHRLCLGGTRTLPFVRRFMPKEVEAATRGFTAVLDAAGTAYRARFVGGLVATVVRLRHDDDHRQGEGGGPTDAFYLELQLLARLNHRHVVRLRGFALAHHARFLVFDHMENRSLNECLHVIWSFTMKSSFCKHAIVTQTDPKESSSLSTTCGVASPSSSPRRRYPTPNTAMFFPVPRSQVLVFVYVKQFTDEKQRILFYVPVSVFGNSLQDFYTFKGPQPLEVIVQDVKAKKHNQAL